MCISVVGIVAAFALGTYMMLAPVAPKVAVAVCVLCFLVLLYQNSEGAIKITWLDIASMRRAGMHKVCLVPWSASLFVINNLLNLWPIVVIFGLSALNHTGGKVEAAAQPPTPLA